MFTKCEKKNSHTLFGQFWKQLLQSVLQIVTNFVTKFHEFEYNYWKVWQKFITKCDRRLLQSVINIRKWDVTRDTVGKDKIEKLLDEHGEKIVSEGKETIEMMQGEIDEKNHHEEKEKEIKERE